MKHKKTSSLILLALLILITISPSSLANPTNGPIIWSDERQLTFDPAFTYTDPESGKNITDYLIDSDVAPSITATKTNEIWIAWETDETGNNEIFYKIYNVCTGKWSNDTQLTHNPNYDTGPAILQTSDNTIWVFWASSRTGNNDIFYKNTTNNGASWSTDTPVTNDPRSDVSPAITQTNDGKIWLVWSRKTGTNNEDLFYKTYDTYWSTETQLTNNTNTDQLPSIVQAKDGTIWVFWSQYMPDTHTQICYKTFDGSTWSSETQLTTDPKDNVEPAAFVGIDGTIWVFWASREQRTSATFDLYYKVSQDNGTTWSSTIQFTTHNDEDMQPSATQAPNKALMVVWMSNRIDSNGNDNIDLYHKVSLLGDITGASGVPDGYIDTYDLTAMSKALGTGSTFPPGKGWNQWNPECDLNTDNKVDLEDLIIVSKNYGRHI